MSFLSKVSSEPILQGSITTLFGPNGVGKSSVVARAQLARPLLLDLENGSNYLTVPRVSDIKTFTDFNKALTEVEKEQHGFSLLGIDTVDVLEALLFEELLREGKVKSIEDYGGGFGKGYVRSREMMRGVMEQLRRIANRGIDVILVAHAQVKSHTDPTASASYDRFVMRINDKMASIVKDLSDNVFFASYKTYITEGERGKDTKAVGGDERVMYTEWRAGHDGKNRQNLDFCMPLSYDAFKTASLKQYAPPADDLRNSIASMIPSLKDTGIAAKVQAQVKEAGDDTEKLVKIKARLQTLITK